ncbi:hypothetical protein GCM10020256_49150 [Streptomyces thermocoprophilus]
MASSTVHASQASRPERPAQPNLAFRRLRGRRSPAEFAALVRRAALDIGERVSCDARYIGRVEAGEIRCPNYAYERVFLHMFPGRTLTDLGFAPRSAVRGAQDAGGRDGVVRHLGAVRHPECARPVRPAPPGRSPGGEPCVRTVRGVRRPVPVRRTVP